MNESLHVESMNNISSELTLCASSQAAVPCANGRKTSFRSEDQTVECAAILKRVCHANLAPGNS